MSYSPTIDFLALLRKTSGGVRTERMPGLDYIVSALARAGLISVWVGQSEPTSDQTTTAWFVPYAQSWAAEGELFLWNADTSEYEPASPELWAALFASVAPVASEVVQDVTAPGPAAIQTAATVVRVNQVVSAPISLVMPLSSNKKGAVLISDWRGDAGTNNIIVNLSGADVFPSGRTDWTIASDTGSIFLRPIPGGYAL